MRKGNDEIYQLAKEQALVKKLKNKRFYIYNVYKTFFIFLFKYLLFILVLTFVFVFHQI